MCVFDDKDCLVANSAPSALEFNVRAGWSVAKARYAATHTARVDTVTVEAVAREALSNPPTSTELPNGGSKRRRMAQL